MDNRSQFKEQLRAMVAGRGEGIDIDTPFNWVIEDLENPDAFFEHLPALLPEGSILYVEGTQIIPDVASFYSAHHARNAVAVIRDTVFPAPDIYHFSFSSEVVAGLRRFAQTHGVADLFDHIKGYHGETLLFTFHDAFSGWLLISDHLPEDKVKAFCNAVGATFRREQTKIRDPEQLKRLLWAVEHPDQVRWAAGQSWWRRIWRRIVGR